MSQVHKVGTRFSDMERALLCSDKILSILQDA